MKTLTSRSRGFGWGCVLALLLLMSACGGGGSPTPAPLPTAVTIDAQPTDSTVKSGSAATLSVRTSGPASYQWQRRSAATSAWTDVPSATQATLTLAGLTTADSGTEYRVVVSGPGGQQLLSSSITLRVEPAAVPAAILLGPQDQSVTLGASVSFQVTAQGSDLRYQWEFSADGTLWAALPGEQLSTLQLRSTSAAHAGSYRVKVGNDLGSVTSTPATLALTASPSAPKVMLDPAPYRATAGGRARFEVGFEGVPAPAIQWQTSRDGGSSWQPLSGATQAVLDLQDLKLSDNGLMLRAAAVNAGGSATSAAAMLTVEAQLAAPAFKVQPQDVRIELGETASWRVEVQGNPTPSLQWQISTDGGRQWLNINGATSAQLRLAQLSTREDGQRLRVLATNPSGQAVSDAALVQVAARFQVKPVAGTFTSCFPVDGTLSAARLCPAYGEITRDDAGDLYVWDAANLIRKVEVSRGQVLTLAGKPYEYARGLPDGAGVALGAGGVKWLTAVGTGNGLYFMNNGALRRLDSAGAVRTVDLGSLPRFNGANLPAVAVQPQDVPMVAHLGALWFADGGALFRLDVSGRLTQIAGRFWEVAGGPEPINNGLLGDARGEDVRFREIVGLRSDGNTLLVYDTRPGEPVYVRRVGSDGMVRSAVSDTAPDQVRRRPPVRRDASHFYSAESAGIAIRADDVPQASPQWLVGSALPASAFIVGPSNGRGHVEIWDGRELRRLEADGSFSTLPQAFKDVSHQWFGERWLGCKSRATGTYSYETSLWTISAAGDARQLDAWPEDGQDMGPWGCRFLAYDSGDVRALRLPGSPGGDHIDLAPDDERVTQVRGSPTPIATYGDDTLVFGPDGAEYARVWRTENSLLLGPGDGFTLVRKARGGMVDTLLGTQSLPETFLTQSGPLVSRSNAVLDAGGMLYVGDPLRGRLWRIDIRNQVTQHQDIGHDFGENWQLYLLGNDRLLLATDSGLAIVTWAGVRCDCSLKPMVVRPARDARNR